MPEGHVIVSISRQKGAGGSEIGRCVATRFGFTFLDGELLSRAAERLNEPLDLIEDRDEHRLSFFERPSTHYALGVPFARSAPPAVSSVGTKGLFEAQKSLIEEAAAKGPLVVVGRAAHWILRDQPLMVSVFLHAPIEARVRRTRRILGLASDEEASRIVSQCDSRREAFVRWATGRSWGKAADYHLCVDTWQVGFSSTIDMIVTAVEGLKQAHPLDSRDRLCFSA